jgi:hypothetical protein
MLELLKFHLAKSFFGKGFIALHCFLAFNHVFYALKPAANFFLFSFSYILVRLFDQNHVVKEVVVVVIKAHDASLERMVLLWLWLKFLLFFFVPLFDPSRLLRFCWPICVLFVLNVRFVFLVLILFYHNCSFEVM